jgi:glycosyltransferase involved in cell wall biosynthesis
MVSDIIQAGPPLIPLTASKSVRVAVICDFLEEQWPSMDLNGDLLYHFLAQDHAREITAVQLRPDFQKRATWIPVLGMTLSRNADRLANRFIDYPRWLRGQIGHFDLFHLVDHSYSQLVHTLPAERTIVTCHDLDTFQCLLKPEREKRPRWFRAMTQRILEGFQRAAHVICNSRATRDELAAHGLFPPERMTVIHSGVHPAFSCVPDPSADAEAERLLAPDSSSRPMLLSVGSTIPRKRMDVLLRVFAAVRQEFPSARLVRAGGPFTAAQQRLANELGVDQSVLVLPFLSRNVLASVYRRATILLQPSEAEGFGMPLAEAMSCGCPVLASSLASLREIGGSACQYCPAGDVEAWTGKMVAFLREHAQGNSGPSDALRQQALAQAALYSWAENARQTVLVYRTVLQQLKLPLVQKERLG